MLIQNRFEVLQDEGETSREAELWENQDHGWEPTKSTTSPKRKAQTELIDKEEPQQSINITAMEVNTSKEELSMEETFLKKASK